MRPSDHLLVLWQWDTAVRLHRRAQELARDGQSAEWGRTVTAAVRAASELEQSLSNLAPLPAGHYASPCETGKGE